MKPNLNLKDNQGQNVELDKPLNQSLQSGSENVSYMSSNGPPGNCCKVLNKHVKGHVLGGQNGGSTMYSIKLQRSPYRLK